MSDLEEPKTGVTRRTVAKAMAWSVPAVALAVPAAATDSAVFFLFMRSHSLFGVSLCSRSCGLPVPRTLLPPP